jgi:hypothetical protein
VDRDQKFQAWWSTLGPEQRREARAVHEVVPEWMIESLAAAGIMLVTAHLDDHPSDVQLMTTALRDFLAAQHDNEGQD